jgi:hypothetical protein
LCDNGGARSDKSSQNPDGPRDIRTINLVHSVKHVYETYDGDHTNRLKERWEEHVMPFFGNSLSFPAKSSK